MSILCLVIFALTLTFSYVFCMTLCMGLSDSMSYSTEGNLSLKTSDYDRAYFSSGCLVFIRRFTDIDF